MATPTGNYGGWEAFGKLSQTWLPKQSGGRIEEPTNLSRCVPGFACRQPKSGKHNKPKYYDFGVGNLSTSAHCTDFHGKKRPTKEKRKMEELKQELKEDLNEGRMEGRTKGHMHVMEKLVFLATLKYMGKAELLEKMGYRQTELCSAESASFHMRRRIGNPLNCIPFPCMVRSVTAQVRVKVLLRVLRVSHDIMAKLAMQCSGQERW
ncbi:uncharacterized protein EV422DRAFT_34615 [Fimicolochytrium jonesii]|uniref:uncharacterized protein n=1 Tax=Fimicolochytrium jonesii TaxID=1396493 RepID=UPI0022FE76F8|nr:uncharacterized protein EV422DRAFT_34615 [Fimicolochytrium jonesii]KAI8827280.1 hypothetical protein EV422DRAFT_34615 [Fimicolochytrium jonesii]